MVDKFKAAEPSTEAAHRADAWHQLKRQLSRRLTWVLILAGALGFGAWLRAFDVAPDLLETTLTHPVWLVAGILSFLLPMLLHTIRYQLLLQYFTRTRWRFVLQMVLACTFLNHFVVAKIGDFAEPVWLQNTCGLNYWRGLQVGLVRFAHSAAALALLITLTLVSWSPSIHLPLWPMFAWPPFIITVLGIGMTILALPNLNRLLSTPSSHPDHQPGPPASPLPEQTPLEDGPETLETDPRTRSAAAPPWDGPETQETDPCTQSAAPPLQDGPETPETGPRAQSAAPPGPPQSATIPGLLQRGREALRDLLQAAAEVPARAHLLFIALAFVELAVDGLPFLLFVLAAGAHLSTPTVLTAATSLNVIEYLPTPPAMLGVQSWVSTLALLPAHLPEGLLVAAVAVHRTARTAVIGLAGLFPLITLSRAQRQPR